MSTGAWFWIGVAFGLLLSTIGWWVERRELVQENKRLRLELAKHALQIAEEHRWQQILGASLYDPDDDD